jgi:hypothetical protein
MEAYQPKNTRLLAFQCLLVSRFVPTQGGHGMGELIISPVVGKVGSSSRHESILDFVGEWSTIQLYAPTEHRKVYRVHTVGENRRGRNRILWPVSPRTAFG